MSQATQAAAAPGASDATPAAGEPLIRLENVTKYFDIRGGFFGSSKIGSVKAVDGSRSRSDAVRRSGSSASPGAGRRRSARWSCG